MWLVPSAPRAGRAHLVEKGPFQALYDGEGHLTRVVYDRMVMGAPTL